MKWSDKSIKYRNRVIAWMFFVLCVTLVSGCCRRHVAKYGGPPNAYKQIKANLTASVPPEVKNY
jgi:hypothetical protein